MSSGHTAGNLIWCVLSPTKLRGRGWRQECQILCGKCCHVLQQRCREHLGLLNWCFTSPEAPVTGVRFLWLKLSVHRLTWVTYRHFRNSAPSSWNWEGPVTWKIQIFFYEWHQLLFFFFFSKPDSVNTKLCDIYLYQLAYLSKTNQSTDTIL